MKPIVIFSLLIIMTHFSFADSPITSTYFCTAYLDIPEVIQAQKEGKITKQIGEFLLSDRNPADQKVAVINALGWDIDGKHNTDIFRQLMSDKYRMKQDQLDYTKLSGDELLCLGYLAVMDNYFNPQPAIMILQAALQKNPESYTYNIILGLAKAQSDMDKDFCLVWRDMHPVNVNRNLKRDMREEAVKQIFEYINIYEETCDE